LALAQTFWATNGEGQSKGWVDQVDPYAGHYARTRETGHGGPRQSLAALDSRFNGTRGRNPGVRRRAERRRGQAAKARRGQGCRSWRKACDRQTSARRGDRVVANECNFTGDTGSRPRIRGPGGAQGNCGKRESGGAGRSHARYARILPAQAPDF